MAKQTYLIWYPIYDEKGNQTKKKIGYVTASSPKQAFYMFSRGWGRHIVPGAMQLASIRDRLQAEAIK
ncbi:MAG: hypothetical protein PHO91_03185 [Patescibacteria group bacterium]|nr:hypothetical protein [Patescibacteria group bacterium]